MIYSSESRSTPWTSIRRYSSESREVAREDWIKAKARRIKDTGAEQWLTSLLGVLEGGYLQDEDGAAFGFRRIPPGQS